MAVSDQNKVNRFSARQRKLLRKHISDMSAVESENLRQLINKDDAFREAWRESTPELSPSSNNRQKVAESAPTKKMQSKDSTATADKGEASTKKSDEDKAFSKEINSGAHDKRLLEEAERIDSVELEQLLMGNHPKQDEANQLGGLDRLREILATAKPMDLSEKISDAQRYLLNQSPSFKKAYEEAGKKNTNKKSLIGGK